MRTLTALTAVVALLAGACSSSYTPHARGHVGIMMRGGAQVYVRDDRTYSAGLLGGGLADAVAGDPQAVAAANEFSSRLKTGLLVTLGGLACSVVSAGLAASKINNDPYDEGTNNDVPPELWVSLGCLVVSMGGLGYMITAEPYRWDAINIFNDNADARTPAYPATPAGPPGGFGLLPTPTLPKKTISLKMRDD
jgi:hypothetical protein